MSDEQLYALYFAQCVGMLLHPGNQRDKPFDPFLASEMADVLFEIHRSKFPCPQC